MKCSRAGLVFGIVLAWAGVALAAEEMSKALPTLLIKGEVVSVDANDPAATLLKVKDRYGFETPIFLTTDTKVMQGDAATTLASLSAGVPVEVEYNFDVNTAKRHAVSVKLTIPGEATAPPAPANSIVPPVETPAEPEAAPADASAPVASPSATPDSSGAPTGTEAAPAPSESMPGDQPAPGSEAPTTP